MAHVRRRARGGAAGSARRVQAGQGGVQTHRLRQTGVQETPGQARPEQGVFADRDLPHRGPRDRGLARDGAPRRRRLPAPRRHVYGHPRLRDRTRRPARQGRYRDPRQRRFVLAARLGETRRAGRGLQGSETLPERSRVRDEGDRPRPQERNVDIEARQARPEVVPRRDEDPPPRGAGALQRGVARDDRRQKAHLQKVDTARRKVRPRVAPLLPRHPVGADLHRRPRGGERLLQQPQMRSGRGRRARKTFARKPQ